MSRAKGQTDKTPRQSRPSPKLTQSQRARQAKMGEDGLSPLKYLLDRMRDENEAKDVRLDCAKAAAPYVHPKLMSTHVTGGPTKSHEEWVKELADMADDGAGD